MAAGRVRFRDLVPYEAPASLSDLHGPASGTIQLPLAVFWGPSRVFDLDDQGQRRMAYQALVREGSPPAQEELLNEALLRREWAGLILPRRCRALWQQRFPSLAEARLDHG